MAGALWIERSEQRAGPIDGIGLARPIECGRGGEPLSRLVLTTELLEDLGVEIPQSDRSWPRSIAVETATSEYAERGVELTQVASSAGDHDPHLGFGLRIQAAEVRIGQRAQCGLRTTQRPFAVSNDG